jgi:hypothetical protein
MASSAYSSWCSSINSWHFLVSSEPIPPPRVEMKLIFLPRGLDGRDLPQIFTGLFPLLQEYSLGSEFCVFFSPALTTSLMPICRCKFCLYSLVYRMIVNQFVTELHLRLLPTSYFVRQLPQGSLSFPNRCLKIWVFNGPVLCLAVWLRL